MQAPSLIRSNTADGPAIYMYRVGVDVNGIFVARRTKEHAMDVSIYCKILERKQFNVNLPHKLLFLILRQIEGIDSHEEDRVKLVKQLSSSY